MVKIVNKKGAPTAIASDGRALLAMDTFLALMLRLPLMLLGLILVLGLIVNCPRAGFLRLRDVIKKYVGIGTQN